MKIKSIKTKKAFSIIELIVSLGVMSIITVIFFNSLLTSLQITFKNINRSALREEATTVVGLVGRDLRNADQIIRCDQLYCEFNQGGISIMWGICDSSTNFSFITTLPEAANRNNLVICKKQNGSVVYESGSNVRIQSFQFEKGFSNISSNTRANIIFTLIIEHSNTELKINNIVRQTSVSLRNYEI